MAMKIASAILDELQHRARMAAPKEICGLLFGSDERIEEYLITANVSADPEHFFEIDPSDLINAERAQRDGGRQIAGYFHSHPHGQVLPSTTDAALAAPDGRAWLIIDGSDAGVWRAQKDGAVHARFEPEILDCAR